MSFVPSERYERAQHASVSVSSSVEDSVFARTGSAGLTFLKSGGGFPRVRFETVHVAFRCSTTGEESSSSRSRCGSACACRTRSRHRGESPAMLPRPQAACPRTSGSELWSSLTKTGTAPLSITCSVCSVLPLATASTPFQT